MWFLLLSWLCKNTNIPYLTSFLCYCYSFSLHSTAHTHVHTHTHAHTHTHIHTHNVMCCVYRWSFHHETHQVHWDLFLWAVCPSLLGTRQQSPRREGQRNNSLVRTHIHTQNSIAVAYFIVQMLKVPIKYHLMLSIQRPLTLAKIVGAYSIGFKNTKNGNSKRLDVLVMENLLYGHTQTNAKVTRNNHDNQPLSQALV